VDAGSIRASDNQNVPPQFDAAFRQTLTELFRLRRDVRHFLTTPIPDDIVTELIELACLAPSVGYSQPWRFVKVDDPRRREAVLQNFAECNKEALHGYSGSQAELYASLKLAGLAEAPVHLAVFVDRVTPAGSGLGRKTMPSTLDHSVVMAVHTLWLAARAYGIGVGWVSILNPPDVERILGVPEGWSLIAYLCLGYPVEEQILPELERLGWERKTETASIILQR
jgi:5,6-dimethylbenzimidazole synthase